MTHYLYPRECGNRTNVRYAYIHNDKVGLLISSDNFEFPALSYTPYEIENARHQDEFLLSKDAKHFVFLIKGILKNYCVFYFRYI
ncbi:MAG: beta-galactosidase small subunit [Erysipelotrichaceae bacterium]|nr:beta-galactosidase small subunit [Erysipelotrichaceae bacterium]